MLHPRLALRLAITVLLAACSDAARAPTQPTPPAPTVFLEDIVVPNLPSPYYHFTYDAAGRIDSAAFASGFFAYHVTYDGDRIATMRNDAVGNRDRIDYVYDQAGRATLVSYVDVNGATYARLHLAYDGSRLTGIVRERLLDGVFVVNREVSFSYGADGNVQDVTEHYPRVAGQQEDVTTVDRYEDYDDGINVEAFSLLHDEFFDHLVLLPGVQLQKSNPRHVTHTGGTTDYTVDVAFVYDDQRRPREKNGELTYTSGTDAGRRFPIRSLFTYY